MNSDEKQGLLVPRGDQDVPKQDIEQSASTTPLNVNATPDFHPEEEIIDNTEHDWDEYEDYQIKTDAKTDTRSLEDIAEINKITKYYKKYLLEDKKPLKDKDNLSAITKMLNHQKLFEEGKFSWELVLNDMDEILTFAKTTISKFSSVFDFEMLDHSLFQKIFPLKMIDQYLSVVNRVYGKPVYDKALRFHTNLLEIFLWHHLNADTRFHPKITTVDINVIDPFLRIQIRQRNREDKLLKDKYFNSLFDMKKFVFKLLDLYFPNVTWRYVGGGQEMHRWALLLMLQMFELGLFTTEEMPDLVNLLLQKLENLLVLEKRSYQDFKTTLVNYPNFIVQLKAYFYECKQIVGAICIHIAMLLNDHAFKDSYPLFNKEISVDDVPKGNHLWENAYFGDANIGNILNRIMTTYLFQLTEPLKNNEREKMFSLLNDFVMLTMDIENDVCYVSSKVVNQPLIDFYFTPPRPQEEFEAAQIAKDLENLIDQLSFLNLNRKKEYSENNVLSGLKRYLVSLAKYSEGKNKDHFKNLLGLRGVPNILLAIFCSLTNMDARKEVELICGLALVETCKGSTINQVFVTNEPAMSHWNYIFSKKKLTGVILQTSIFEGNLHLFYVHRSMIKKLLINFKESMDSKWNLEEEGCKTTQEWFAQFKEGVVDNEDDVQLDILITFYVNCRFLCDLVVQKDTTYESKFHNLEIQELLVKPFFNLFNKIILDETFLPKIPSASDSIPVEGSQIQSQKYDFTPKFQKASAFSLNEFVEKKSTNNITESELRCAVFEVAMLTMKLLNKACTGLYPYWIYKYHVKTELPKLLEKTKYVLDLPHLGAEYRAIILEYYTNFRIFPNNNLLTFRTAEFKDPIVPTKEERVLTSHKNGTIINEIIEELGLIGKLENQWENYPAERSGVHEYYYQGIMGLLYKYFKGVYSSYSQDKDLDTLLTSLEKLREEFQKIGSILSSKFSIIFDFGGQALGGGFGGLLAGFNQVIPATKANSAEDKLSNRIPDNEEKMYPKLATVRLLCEQFIGALDHCFHCQDDEQTTQFQQNLHSIYSRKSAIYITKSNIEPWSGGTSGNSGSSFVSNKINKSQVSSTLNLAKILVANTGLVSSELRYFYTLMDIYQEKKIHYLNKPTDENIFLKFLESGPEYAPKLVAFITRLVDRFYQHLTTTDEAEKKKVTEESEISYYNIDSVVKVFLQNDIVYSVYAFFSKVIADSESIRNALYDSLTQSGDDQRLSSNMLTLLYNTCSLLHPIVLNKTFMDYEYQILSEKYLSLTSLLKNICENNCQKFKVFLGTYTPYMDTLVYMNKVKKPLIYDAYVRMESAYAGFNVHTNKDAILKVDDKAEMLPYMSNWIKMVTEFVNGPCLHNQKQIYIFRTDFYTGTTRRMVDNMESSFYFHKNIVIEYIDGLLEGNNEDIVKHFASNFTFDIIYDLICTSIKRLYIYTMVHGKPKEYAKLVKAAREHKAKNTEEKRKQELALKGLIDQELSLYNSYSEENSEKKIESVVVETKVDNENKGDELLDYRNITEDILDYVKVTDYKKIMTTYLRSDVFSRHVILTSVFKLNDFMNRFASQVAGFKISLENIYTHLIDVYREEVPTYITNKFPNYEPKENKVSNEKLVLYMFLSTITTEIELINPSNKQTVKLNYPLVPKTFFLTEVTKDEFIHTANTSAMTLDLLMEYETLEIEMDYNLALYRKNHLLYAITSDETFHHLKLFLWIISLVLNIVLIVYYRRDTGGSRIIHNAEKVLWGLAGIIIAVSGILLIMWFALRYWHKVLTATARWKEYKALKVNKWNKFYSLYIKESILQQLFPLLFLYYIIFSFLGIFVQRFFFTLLLLTIVSLSTTMTYVVKAITTRFEQLALTVLLMLTVIYCYAVLSSEYFFNALNSNQAGSSFYNCTQLWECLMFVFDSGLRNGGGIGDVTIPYNPLAIDGNGLYVGKFFFDVIFFFMINIISLNIIFGIIVDTFASMREENDQREQALASSCMVCSQEKVLLRKEGKDFKTHIDHDHGFWKYSDFLAYLTSKDKADQTGFENLVWDQFEHKLIDWIPAKDLVPEDPEAVEAENKKKKAKEEEDEAYKVKVTEKLEQLSKTLNEVLEKIPPKTTAALSPAPAP